MLCNEFCSFRFMNRHLTSHYFDLWFVWKDVFHSSVILWLLFNKKYLNISYVCNVIVSNIIILDKYLDRINLTKLVFGIFVCQKQKCQNDMCRIWKFNVCVCVCLKNLSKSKKEWHWKIDFFLKKILLIDIRKHTHSEREYS